MVCVFAGMTSGELVMFQQMGFGLAIAILIDATLVRTIVMPAAVPERTVAAWRTTNGRSEVIATQRPSGR